MNAMDAHGNLQSVSPSLSSLVVLLVFFSVLPITFKSPIFTPHVLLVMIIVNKVPKFELTMEVGRWGVGQGPGLTQILLLLGKSSQDSPKSVLIFWSSIPCVFYFLFVYTVHC